MKRVLVTGANSYVGTNVTNWLSREPNIYYVSSLDVQNPEWKLFDFESFDIVFHVAGIAHVSRKKSLEDLYYKVNTDLAIEIAQKSKVAGIKQFIFMSSMIVYSSGAEKISSDTIPTPDNFYGKSKLAAENGILDLADEQFKVVIIRSPMIYGPKSKGNFSKLVSLSKVLPMFPYFFNKRSMLYIDNLANTVKGLIDNNSEGVFFPQNKYFSCTSNIVKEISILLGRKIWFFKFLNPIIRMFRRKFPLLRKIFGDSYYDESLSRNTDQFCTIGFAESIQRTVFFDRIN